MHEVDATAQGASQELAAHELLSIHRSMLMIRAFDEKAIVLFQEGVVKGTAHSYIGQEAIAAAVCASLDADDYIASYHRGHGHCIAKGADVRRMMAELMGRSTGYCGGLGGSMHVADLTLGIIGANGIVGAGIPLSSGAALANQLRKRGQVAVAFFGDGAANQGVLHETMNLAKAWMLPLVFVCENNQYALSTPFRRTTAGPSIVARAQAYGMPGVQVDGNDAEEVYFAARDAIARARDGGGPTFIEAHTYRWGQHSMRVNLPELRPEDEMREWKLRDPIRRLEGVLAERGIASADAIARVRDEVAEEIAAAERFGRESPQPSYEAAMSAVYAPSLRFDEPQSEGDRKLSFIDALNEALAQEMEQDPDVVLLGEDIGECGGIFQVTRGLMDRFGEDRVRDTPISEATFVGCGVGAALAGFRPVVEIQIFDFVVMTMDQIVNQAAKLRFMLGGKATVPLVIRGPQGGGIRMAAQHSQSLEAWFTHVPGLVVVGPSTPYDAKGLLIAAIRENNPVIFLENKLLYTAPPGPVPEQSYAIPIGVGKVRQPGTDVTVVATMSMVPRALAAARRLANDGISVEVIDPRTLYPLDEEMILESVRKTHRLVVAHEACTQFGFGAEISALVQEKAFDWLDAPVVRVGAPHMPMPYNDELERATIPTQQRIEEAIRQTMQ